MNERASQTHSPARRCRVLAVASGGGHWVQLMRLKPALVGCRVTYVTVRRGYQSDVSGERFRVVNDATRWNRVRLVLQGLRIAWIVLIQRPDVVISTGAAPGYFALRFGKLFRARTIWVDSIANVDAMSMTGMLVRRYADLWLTQWPDLATPNGPVYHGAVL